jgi:hypothetical protein
LAGVGEAFHCHAVATVLLALYEAELSRCDTLLIRTEPRHCLVDKHRTVHLCLPGALADEHALAWDEVKKNGLAEEKMSTARAWRWPRADRRSGESDTLSHAHGVSYAGLQKMGWIE